MATPAALSVYEMGKSPLFTPPDFNLLSKPTTTVDVGRLQSEFRALHSRLALLEQAALNSSSGPEAPDDGDKPSEGSSGAGISITVPPTFGSVEASLDADAEEDMAKASESSSVDSGDPNASNRKIKGGVAAPAVAAEMNELSERLEALATSMRRGDKAQGSKEKAAALARSMDANKMQLAIEARVTSDELQQAVGANADKIVALQSSVETALSDRFRRMQDMVHAQMGGLLQMVQALSQQQPQNGHRGSKFTRDSFTSSRNESGDFAKTSEKYSDDDSDAGDSKSFISSVTGVVQRLLQEAEQKRRRSADAETFEALQEDYETFKGRMEEKADRQDNMASAVEDTQARLEEAETNIAAITANMDLSAEELQATLDESSNRQSQLEDKAEAASAQAADAHSECGALRAFVSDSKRDALAEARQDAESIAARAEGRVKAEVQKTRGDARTATDLVSERLGRLNKKVVDDLETQKSAISAAKALSEKAFATAKSANARAAENDASLERAEGKIASRIDTVVRAQTASADEILERVADSEAELCRTREDLKHLITENRVGAETLRNEHAKLRESAKGATQELRSDVVNALGTMVVDEMDSEPSGASRYGGRNGGGGVGKRGQKRGGRDSDSGSDGRSLSSLGASLRKQCDSVAEQVITLQRSGVGMATVMRKLEIGLHVLTTKELFWQAVDLKLAAHQRSVGDICLQVEEATTQRRSRMSLPKEAQACLAGDMQRVAKLLATKADYEVIREIAKLDSPEQTGHDWDERVERLRQTYLERFTKECREALDKRAPELRTNFNGEEVRGKFLWKVNDALRVALSKFAPTTPGATLFGKIKLKAKACVACDRPFTPSATGRPGPTPTGGLDGAAVEPTALPDENSHITKDNFRPHTSHGRLGSPSRSGSSPDLFEPQTSIYSVMTGGRSSPQSQHVFRGGFKLPKHMKSPLHAAEANGQSPIGIGQASALLHKSQTMTGLYPSIYDGRPSTSGGTRSKSRPLTSPSHHGLYFPGGAGGDDGGSVVSAFTMQTDVSRAGAREGQGHGRMNRSRIGGEWDEDECGRRAGGDGEVPQRDDDANSRDSRVGHIAYTEADPAAPYFASAHHLTLSHQQQGSVRLLQ